MQDKSRSGKTSPTRRPAQMSTRSQATGAAAGTSARIEHLQTLADRSRAVGQLKTLRSTHGVTQKQDNVIDEVNKGYKHKTEMSVSDMADSLSKEVGEFSKLRNTANDENRKLYDKDLGYKPVPKGQLSTAAHFKDGDAYFARNSALAQTLSNIIFETANAAQGGRFARVEADYANGTIMDKAPSNYGVSDLPDKLMLEWASGDPAARRSLI